MLEYGVPILLFSGGEPLMRKRVFELMAYSRKIGVRCAGYYGKRGRRAGTSAMKLSTAPPSHSTIPILWMW